MGAAGFEGQVSRSPCPILEAQSDPPVTVTVFGNSSHPNLPARSAKFGNES